MLTAPANRARAETGDEVLSLRIRRGRGEKTARRAV